MNDQILETLPREIIWRAQTPQVFAKQALQEALELAEAENIIKTDEASLLERIGYQVGFVEGSSMNIKITTEEDWVFAEAIYKSLNND
jgi:2-C-methyl-D-erythritol 4-phosphate cytidylyltransferase